MKYENKKYNTFVKDMKKVGYEAKEYHGRYFYVGPAIYCETYDYQDVIRATSIRLQRDSLGLGIIVYPAA